MCSSRPSARARTDLPENGIPHMAMSTGDTSAPYLADRPVIIGTSALLDADPSAQLGTLADRAHYPGRGPVEHVHGQRLVVRQHEGAGLHDPHPRREGLVVGQRGVAAGVRVDVRVAVVD